MTSAPATPMPSRDRRDFTGSRHTRGRPDTIRCVMLAGMSRSLLIVAVLAATAHADGENAALRALLARTDDIAKEVARVRGLKLKHKIPNEVVDRTELRKRLVELTDDHET